MLSAAAGTVYSNRFDSVADLAAFTVIGEKFVSYTPPPLHTISIDNGRLRIDTTAIPSGGSATLVGSAFLMAGKSVIDEPYQSLLSQNPGVVSWGFNVANSDGTYNNGFHYILACSEQDPTSITAKGYELKGGGMVGNRMILSRFNYGVGGGAEVVIDLGSGLGTLPQMGSFRVEYDPEGDVWTLLGALGSSFIDPEGVTTVLGTGADSLYTNRDLAFFGVGGRITGTDYFDNVTIGVVPEPHAACLVLSGMVAFLLRSRKRS